jgi:HTH-type transcriptional regulator/antitoxin HigA
MAATVLERPHVLHSAKEYDEAVDLVRTLLEKNPKKGTKGYLQLELLSLLLHDYETRNIPEPAVPSPTAVVDFMLNQRGMTRSDLAPHLGGKSRVSEFFAGKRPLSTSQIKALRDLLGIPADLLLQ